MDAIKFINTYKSICASYTSCQYCPLFKMHTACTEIPAYYPDEYAAEITKAVEDWSATYPAITRAALFKKTHPFAVSDSSGALSICPVVVNKQVICPLNGECEQCRKNYWLKEVQNGR